MSGGSGSKYLQNPERNDTGKALHIYHSGECAADVQCEMGHAVSPGKLIQKEHQQGLASLKGWHPSCAFQPGKWLLRGMDSPERMPL